LKITLQPRWDAIAEVATTPMLRSQFETMGGSNSTMSLNLQFKPFMKLAIDAITSSYTFAFFRELDFL